MRSSGLTVHFGSFGPFCVFVGNNRRHNQFIIPTPFTLLDERPLHDREKGPRHLHLPDDTR